MSHSSSSSSGWKSQAGYVWAVMGSAVGFANVLSFSAQAYKNGGGAFLVPYFIALFILGVPLLILEGIIGQRTQSPLVTAYGQVWGRVGKMLGWLAVIACLSIGGFYIVLTGYSLGYTYFALTNSIGPDSQKFFLETFLKVTPSLKEFGSLSLLVFLPTLGTATLSYFVMVRSVREGIERVCSIFMPLLVLIMVTFAIVATCLPGGLDGWVYYLKPNFTRLGDPLLWRDVFGQLFFSLSLGLGIIVGYSRHTGKAANIPRALLYVALGDFAVSFISGAAIFACLSHMSLVTGTPFASLLTSDSSFEIGFIVFPKILAAFGPSLAQPIGTLFFFCIFIAGITGLFSITESIAGNIEVEFATSRKKAVLISLIAITCLSLLFSMGNASHLIDALAPMVIGTNMLIGGLMLIAAFQFNSLEISRDPVWRTGRWNLNRFFLRFVAPCILSAILIGNLTEEFQSFDLAKGVRWTWFILAIGSSALLARRAKASTIRAYGKA
jgi:NSS family neurotransmitter:Na+ symporter